MKANSIQKAKLNIVTALISQLVIVVCGIIIPRIMIRSFGSTMYGLTTSIAQFLAYIALLEGGIGRVARAELYGPLAQKDDYETSRVYHAIRYFFTVVGFIFCGYTLFLSFAYYDIAHLEGVERDFVFVLIWIISIITLAKYLGGQANSTLLNADQKQYICNIIVILSTFANAVLVVLLIQLDCSILIVKLVSSLVYLLHPIFYTVYVRKHYSLPYVGRERSKLKQKWTGIGQHIAYFLHTNTDVVLLTIFADLRFVAVYSVYRMVISSIRQITASFTGGMEAVFGELIAKKEFEALRSSFRIYQWMLSTAAIILFGTTMVLIIPFIKIYTAGITDAEYIQPLFAVLMLFAEEIDCVVHPCCSLPVSANRLKETQWGSYGEALINISLSLLLVRWNPLLGVAVGTLAAALFKWFYYMLYSAKKILRISVWDLSKNFLFTNITLGGVGILGGILVLRCTIDNLYVWCLWGCVAVATITLITIVLEKILYPSEFKLVIHSLKR